MSIEKRIELSGYGTNRGRFPLNCDTCGELILTPKTYGWVGCKDCLSKVKAQYDDIEKNRVGMRNTIDMLENGIYSKSPGYNEVVKPHVDSRLNEIVDRFLKSDIPSTTYDNSTEKHSRTYINFKNDQKEMIAKWFKDEIEK